VTYRGQWTTTTSKDAPRLIDAVTAALQQDGLSVRSVQTDAGFLAKSTIVGFAEAGLTFNVTLQLQVSNGMGFGDPNDIISIVRHEVYAASGIFPVADSVPQVQMPRGDGGGDSTGQPPGPGAPQDWSQWLQDNASWIALGVGAVVLLPMLLGRR